MVGGKKEVVDQFEELFHDIAAPGAYRHVGPSGAGHYVKMVHNAIEYGMMQSLAEGFGLLKDAPYDIDLPDVADLYTHNSLIVSALLSHLKAAYEKEGEDLDDVSGSVPFTSSVELLRDYAEILVKNGKLDGKGVPIISGSVAFREESHSSPSYVGKVLNALRNSFGGNAMKKNSKNKE
jgi:6-phosphogluconate dehydrogenase